MGKLLYIGIRLNLLHLSLAADLVFLWIGFCFPYARGILAFGKLEKARDIGDVRKRDKIQGREIDISIAYCINC